MCVALYNCAMKNSRLYRCIFTILILLGACTQPKNTYILSEDVMVSILVRLHIAEAQVSNGFIRGDSTLYYFKFLEDSIMTMHRTDKRQFDSSYKYYIQHIHQMNSIYHRVSDSLQRREESRDIHY